MMAKSAKQPPQRVSPDRVLSPDEPEPARKLSGRVLSSAQFWALMEQWKVPDAVALDLIQFPGKPGKSGKRPRFRFTTKQGRLTSYMAEIDVVIAAAGRDPAWLHRKSRSAAFSGKTPIDHMIDQGETGMADVLRELNRAALRSALAGQARKLP
jgi:hypothetical protein